METQLSLHNLGQARLPQIFCIQFHHGLSLIVGALSLGTITIQKNKMILIPAELANKEKNIWRDSLCHFCLLTGTFNPFAFNVLSQILSSVIYIKFIYLFIYFWLRWVFVAACRLSLVASSGGYSSMRWAGFPWQRLLLLQSMSSRHAGFCSCGARAQLLCSMWDLPRPGLEPVSPVLAGGFLTTVPPGKHPVIYFLFLLLP